MARKQAQEDSPRWVAARAGEVFYQHSAECERCGSVVRYTSSGQCVDCTKLRAKENSLGLREMLRSNKREG